MRLHAGSRRISNAAPLLAVSLMPALALAQSQRPLPVQAPVALVAASARVSVIADDALEPDRLRDLARPTVTLWLNTSSNTLKRSTIEHLSRFDRAFVQLRAPFGAVDAAQFAALPRVGAFVGLESAEAVAARLPASHPLAVTITHCDEPTVQSLRHVRPVITRWEWSTPVDLFEWAVFNQLPGRKIVVPNAAQIDAVNCEPHDGAPSAELHVASLLALNARTYPCGRGTRVVLPANVDVWLLQSLAVRDPSVEFVFRVADAHDVKLLRRIFDELRLGPAR